MSAYTAFVSGFLFPLHERLKGHDSVRVRRELEDSQWWPRERIAGLQVERLKALLAEAGSRVPYYRRVFAEARFDPAGVSGVEDLKRLPTLTKPGIRANLELLRNPNARGLQLASTGGSSGEPLRFYVGPRRVTHDVAAKWRATRWWGVDIGDSEIVLWGSPIELGAQDRLRLLRDKALRSELISAFDMSPGNLHAYVARILAVRPKMLFGYPYSMAHLARHALQGGVRLDHLGIRVVFVTSEQLYPDQRAIIERVFGCPVANGYGGRDAGFIAHECPAGGMHICAEDLIVELLDERGQHVPAGQPGEVTVTHLASGDFPFLRYQTGDIATLDDRACRCGRGLPLLGEVQGRTNDFLISTAGTPIPCGAFTYLLRGVVGIDSYKVVQESLERTRLMYVAGAGFSPDSLDPVVAGFRRRLGECVEIVLEPVAQLPKERSGKFRYIVSRLPPPGATGVPREGVHA